MNTSLRGSRIERACAAILWLSIGATMVQAADPAESTATQTPIKHVIVIIGENHSFDNVFATYVPGNGSQIWNLQIGRAHV